MSFHGRVSVLERLRGGLVGWESVTGAGSRGWDGNLMFSKCEEKRIQVTINEATRKAVEGTEWGTIKVSECKLIVSGASLVMLYDV